MKHNPEFLRQLQLNWHPLKPLWTGLIVLLVLALAGSVSNDPAKRSWHMLLTAGAGFALSWLVLASAGAARSLSDERQERTWDWQRLSALGPWQMVWGKQLGSNVTSLLLALWFGIAMLVMPHVWPAELAAAPVLASLALMTLAGLALQALIMCGPLLQGMHEPGSKAASNGLWGLLFIAAFPSFIATSQRLNEGQGVLWWEWQLPIWGLAFCLVLLALALAWLACWRLMAEALDLPTLPWAWPLGLLAVSLVLAGFAAPEHRNAPRLLMQLTLAGTWLMALRSMNHTQADWRITLHASRLGQWRRALQNLPLWPVSALLAGLAIAFMGFRTPVAGSLESLMLLAWVLREVGVASALGLMRRQLRSPIGLFLFYTFVINHLLPMLLMAMGHWPIWLSPVGGLWLVPADRQQHLGTAEAGWLLLLLALQAGAAWAWAIHRYRQVNASLQTA